MKNQIKVNLFIIFFNISVFGICQNNFNQNGLREGVWLGYHENGKIKFKGHFKNGKETGVFNYYDLLGNKVIELNYIEPGVTCSAVLFYSNGVIQSQGTYQNQLKDSLWIFFNQDGEKIAEENYKMGNLNGHCVYFQDGLKSEMYTFLNGEKNGVSNIYYQSGYISMSSHYLNNLLHGKATFYFNNNNMNIETEGLFYKGLKDSIWKSYNIDGDIINIELYNKGKLIDSNQE